MTGPPGPEDGSGPAGAGPAGADAASGVELLERAVAYALGSLNLVAPALMVRPTPCAGWDLRTLLWHVDDSLTALCEAAGSGSLAVDAVPAATGDLDPVEAVKASACRLLGRCAAADGPAVVSVGGHRLGLDVVAGTGALEIAVHGWDVARACGHDRPLPPSFAADLLELARLLVTDADRPARFAAPITVAATDGPGDQLVAFLGRSPRPQRP
ncbi:TIGR03086 family metal-binding protein [Jiangella asiatica]|uniref:TIGR03086 family protein n=1 Tax=Jiangella asiatica TaxID=2530372 RepID=A0A4R5D6H2_9ACTN|nr:TIGR03086 family metal-binding protein [Jiangella asiatica]TDE09102.1 TIGR03086 family protein [Jiangella asiatica]